MHIDLERTKLTYCKPEMKVIALDISQPMLFAGSTDLPDHQQMDASWGEREAEDAI